jgi:hypothetical protein
MGIQHQKLQSARHYNSWGSALANLNHMAGDGAGSEPVPVACFQSELLGLYQPDARFPQAGLVGGDQTLAPAHQARAADYTGAGELVLLTVPSQGSNLQEV